MVSRFAFVLAFIGTMIWLSLLQDATTKGIVQL